MLFYTGTSGNPTERMSIDSAGTIYQGTTSPTLHSATTGIVFENGSLLTDVTRGAGKSISVAQNAAVDSGNTWAYLATDEASLFQQFNGKHYFKTAPSGSAGADTTFTTRMLIDNDGNVGIGTTPQSTVGIVDIAGSATNYNTAPMITFRDSTGAADSRNWSIGNLAINY